MKTLGYGATYAYNPSYLHPVINTYLPPELAGEKGKFLKEENDLSEKAWDEELLVRWEREVNGGTPWKGRAEKG
jgi:putative ATPase